MEGMVVDPSCARDRPPAARKRLSSSVASEAADSESDVKSDDSEAFIPAKHRRSRRKSSTSSSSEETVIYSNIVITTVAYVPVDVSAQGQLSWRARTETSALLALLAEILRDGRGPGLPRASPTNDPLPPNRSAQWRSRLPSLGPLPQTGNEIF
ncbi:hypothetical protein HPB52_014182 [Rhipicephalus sanguineus]|uniref:Uncharacterized protein n=1 Tax=Rhipicephalus sanguineus TaxID=34632 RepID=A0A9D4QB65_RHISA|nr:hypothetical protein HPB52_014182 [Rhipicephalus sanguineus]